MASLASAYPVTRLCAALEVSESGYYAWRKRRASSRRASDQQLAEQIEQVYHASRHTYGSPRVQAELQERGVRCGRKRIARLMRQRGLSARRKPQRAHTTDSHQSQPVAPNRLNRAFSAQHPNEKWVADLTGVWTSQGWLYLAAVLDLYSRKVVGWAMAARREDDLVLAALRMALAQRRPQAGLLHHSDRGSQYTSRDYQELLRAWGIEVSMSRKGDCYDNALLESFFATLKGECTDRQRWASHSQARQAIFEYLEVFYNRQRRHSSLEYQSPVAFEQLRA
jgi:transposase InsO family protein